MGLMSFFKGVGEKLFGKTEKEAIEATPDLKASVLLKHVQDLGLSFNALTVKVNGDTVTVVGETEYPTSKIIDLLNLLKVNGEWKIASRVYSRIEKNENVVSSNPAPIAKVDLKSKAKGTTQAVKPKKADDGW